MRDYNERLIDELRSSIDAASRILNRDTGRIGKPCPTIQDVANIRVQLSQAVLQSSELYGAMYALKLTN